jgi:hypothetical protein
MTSITVLLLAAAMASGGVAADSIPRRSIFLEVRGGAVAGEWHGASSAGERSAGPAMRVQAAVAPLPFAALYAGYGRSAFGCRGGFCEQTPVDFTSTGFDTGLILRLGGLWVQGGVALPRLDAEWGTAGGSVQQRAKSEAGLLAAVGLEIPLARGLFITPGARYTRHGAAFGSGGVHDVVQLVGDVGLRFRIPLAR